MPATPTTIRAATAEDLPRLLELWAQLAEQPPPGPFIPTDAERRAFDVVLRDGHQRVLVLQSDGGIVASLIFILIPNTTHGGQPYATVEDVVTDAAHRGRGHGEALMRHALGLARAAGAYKLILTSARRRTEAHRFYEGLGFTAASVGYRLDL
jgi:ribosomal protein S18 acetylase RimI-like enzyme